MALKITAREQKRITQRELIAKASRKLFMEYGFEQVTMDDICEEAGISKSTLYLHIRSKDDLLMVYAAADRNDYLEKHFQYDELKPFRDQFHDFIIANFEYTQHSPREWNRLAYRSYIQLSRQESSPERSYYQRILMLLIRRGMQEGLFRPELSETEYYYMLHDWIIGFFIGWSIQPDKRLDIEQTYMNIIDGMIQSLLK